MDEQTRRAIAASRLARLGGRFQQHTQQAQDVSPLLGPKAPPTITIDNDEYDEELQQALRLSKTEFEKTQSKRKAEEPMEPVSPPKRSRTLPAKGASAPPTKASFAYPDGALRITRTPGRHDAKNCVNLEDVIQKNDLVSACCYSFYIGDDELYQHLPFSQTSDEVPIYIGRDVNMDGATQEACANRGVTGKVSNKQLQEILPTLQKFYKAYKGKNYHAFYSWSPGSSHTKIMFLVYPTFARIVITSCNLMDIDTIGGDNHWYIHDLPKRSSKSVPGTFETDLLTHLKELSTPDAFLDSVRGWYDYSKVKVHLVTSKSGVCSGAKAENHGLLRLRRIIQDLNIDLKDKHNKQELQIDVCAASVGNLSAKWLTAFWDCALGREHIRVDVNSVPDIRLFYPTVGDVRSAHTDAQQAASNIGCHSRPWNSVPANVKNIFHHYLSKDRGRLFHQKLILAYNPKDTDAAPYFVYIGSANFSQSAWGAIEVDKRGNEATDDKKLTKLTNFECGVVIPGHLIKGLLEDGVENWQDGMVPFDLNAKKYGLSKDDRPWNDPRWVKGYEEDWNGPS